MIEGVVAKPGEGKTFLMTRWALNDIKRWRKTGKRPVYTNYRVSGARVLTTDMLLNPTLLPLGAKLYIDELQMWLPSRSYQDVPIEVFKIFSQGRHIGIDLCYTVQHERRIDRIIRELTTYLYWVHAIRVPWSDTPIGFSFERYDADTMAVARVGMGPSPEARSFSLYSRRVAAAYDSFGDLVEEADYLVKNRRRKRNGVYSGIDPSRHVGDRDSDEGWRVWGSGSGAASAAVRASTGSGRSDGGRDGRGEVSGEAGSDSGGGRDGVAE